MKRSRRLLAVDVGNSNIVIGLFEGKRLRWQRRFETSRVGAIHEWSPKNPDSIIISSVVPRLDRPLRNFLRKRFGREPLFVSAKMKLPLRFRKHPAQLGADRIVDMVAVYQKWKQAVLVIDFGTATTFDVVSADGDYVGGNIVPGLGIINAALHEKTAKLPQVRVSKPRRVIGRTTREQIAAGVYYGYLSLVEGMVHRIQKEYGKKFLVVATGGFARLIAKDCPVIHQVDPTLTLEGLRLIAQLQ